MTLSLEGLVAFVLVVLPGVIARAEAERASPIPEDKTSRSVVRDLADALAYGLVISVAAASIGVLVLWAATLGTFGLVDLLLLGPLAVLQRVPVPMAAALIADVFASLLLAEVAGVTRIAARWRAWLVDRFPGQDRFTDVPVWWEVLDTRLRLSGHTEVFLNARLVNGDAYTGVLLEFPILGDDCLAKDFAIWKARFYPAGLASLELEPQDVVLLNSQNCQAIEIRYVTPIAPVPSPASAMGA